jgi:hypothetical protein
MKWECGATDGLNGHAAGVFGPLLYVTIQYAIQRTPNF